MGGRLLRSFVSSLAMLTLLVSTLTICDFIASTILKDGMSKAYAACGSESSKRSSGKTQGDDSAPAPDGTPVASVPEPSILLLIASGLVAAGLYKKLKSRKRKKNNESNYTG